MEKDIVLNVNNLSYRYDDAPKDEYVLKNLNYEFECGVVYAIKGKSGSGKTTLLSLISGLEKKYEGSIKFCTELKDINLDDYRSKDIGIVFQSYNLLPHLTAIENIILSMDISGQKYENKRKKAEELIKSVGISSDKKDRRVLKLSGGEQQRVAIARALVSEAPVILADEPTGNLDNDTAGEIIEILKKLAKERNKCVIVVTHSREVANSADIILELSGKKLKKISQIN